MCRVAIALAAAILVAGCYRESKDYSQSGPPANTNTTPDAAPSRTEPALARNVTVQTVELSEYSIHMPTMLPAGSHQFRVVNAGKEKHNFEIEGNGLEVKLPDDQTRGNQKTIDVDLKPGTYPVYCPVDKHRDKGMHTTLTVQ